MLLRGLRKRCPRCGTGGLFQGWFQMRERCPGCHYRFEREEGWFLGAYVVNFGVTEGLLAIALGIYVILVADNPDVSIVPIVIAGVVAAVGAPIVFYPFSRTVWAAIDLTLRPLDPHEEAEAILDSENGPH